MQRKSILTALYIFTLGIALRPAAMLAADVPAPALTTLYTFLNSPTDGAGVNARLVVDASGNLYGTTISGGPSSCMNLNLPPGCGIIFKLSPPSSGSGPYTETILHSFQSDPDGANTQATVIQGPGGSLFGTTLFGGIGGTPGLGTFYELTPVNGGASWNYKTLIKFSAAQGGAYVPENNVTYYKGNLYTTTQNGGQFGNYGAVIEMVQSGSTWSYNILHSFNGADGNQIQGALAVDPTSGTFYGVAQNGGIANQGTIWQLVPPVTGSAWAFTKLYDFTAGTDGGYLYASPVLGPKGVLYGVAENFGQFGKGTLWTLTPQSGGGWTFQVIHQFGSTKADASTPVSNVIVTANGTIYGTSELGGTHGKGTLFEFAPKTGGGYTETILWNFTGGADGAFPYAAPTLVKAGVLIGTCSEGASANAGTVWQVTF